MIDGETFARALRFSVRTDTPILQPDKSDIKTAAKLLTADMARKFEGLYLHPYLCPAGVPTIGYGATYYAEGRAVTLKDPAITSEQADDLLLWMIETRYMPAVLRLCPKIDDARRLAALTDFAFNLGIGRLQTSTLRKHVNAGAWLLVPGELRKWVMAAGQRMRGLVARREAEIALLPEA
jgi:lysozyme